MAKKMIIGLLALVLAVPLLPATGMSRGGPSPSYGRPGQYGYYGGYRGGYGGYRGGYYGGYRGYRGSDGWIWGLGGLVLGSAIMATALQPPQQVVYVAPPPPAVYAYPPQVAPGMCRWERFVLDGYGRTMLDRYGQPIKEYAPGPCNYPPPW